MNSMLKLAAVVQVLFGIVSFAFGRWGWGVFFVLQGSLQFFVVRSTQRRPEHSASAPPAV
jgi:hypothetical protein